MYNLAPTDDTVYSLYGKNYATVTGNLIILCVSMYVKKNAELGWGLISFPEELRGSIPDMDNLPIQTSNDSNVTPVKTQSGNIILQADVPAGTLLYATLPFVKT